MNKKLLKLILLPLKFTGLTIALIFGFQHANAQSGLLFGTVYTGDPVGGTLFSTANMVLNTGAGTGVNYVMPSLGPNMLVADSQGNLAVGINSSKGVGRIDRNSTTMTIFQTNYANLSLAIDKQDEYIYCAAYNKIYRSIWKEATLTTGVGYYATQPAGTATQVQSIPFFNSGDKAILNNAATASVISFDAVKAITFDAAGNLFYADATNHVIRKLTIEKKTLVTDVASGATSIKLNDVSGIAVGNIVSGVNIPASTYVGSINLATNTITLTASNLTTAKPTIGIVSNKVSLAFVTRIDDIAGILSTPGTDADATFPKTAGATTLNFNATANNYTVGMIFDVAGNLFVTDQVNSRILKIEATAGVVSAAANTSVYFSGASLGSSIGSLAFDANGVLYVSRQASSTIVRIMPASGGGLQTQTIAGSSGKYYITNYTIAASKTSITAAAGSLLNLRVGMLLRGPNLALGTKVASIVNSTTFTIDLEATASGTVAPAAGGITVTSPDGFRTVGPGTVNTGYLNGANGLVIYDNVIYINERDGASVRTLSTVTTLPVMLSREFDAKLNGGAVNLTWTTASEKNNKNFSIKRSVNGSAFAEFKTISSQGESGAVYSTVDYNPANGDNYYQLSQVDNDGTSEILGTRVVKISLKAAPFTIYPNPVQGDTFFVYSSIATNSTIKVADLTGKAIYSHSFAKADDGRYEIKLTNTLGTGIYIITVNGDAQKLIIK